MTTYVEKQREKLIKSFEKSINKFDRDSESVEKALKNLFPKLWKVLERIEASPFFEDERVYQTYIELVRSYNAAVSAYNSGKSWTAVMSPLYYNFVYDALGHGATGCYDAWETHVIRVEDMIGDMMYEFDF